MKIVVIGAESSGKTTLAQVLAQRFSTRWVKEYARGYVENLGRRYDYADVEHVARVQQWEFADVRADELVFFDTDLIITKVWFEVGFKQLPDWFEAALKAQGVDLYLFVQPDLPWVPDGVRENGSIRWELYGRYLEEVKKLGTPYVEISGAGQKREEKAFAVVENFIKNYGK